MTLIKLCRTFVALSVALRTVLLTIVSLLIVLSRPLVAVARLLAAVVVISAGTLLIVVVSGALVVGLLLTLIGLLTLMGLLLIGLRLRGAAPLLVLPRPTLLLLVRLLRRRACRIGCIINCRGG